MKPRRAGFTLLEMMLALAIGVLLLIGLYVALNMNVNATDSGRLQVDQAQVARQVLNVLTTDIKDHLATLDVYPAATTSSSSTTSTTGTASTTSSTSSTSSTTATIMTVPFNLGVQGGTDWCAIYISKVPLAIGQAQLANNGGNSNLLFVDSDLRRICYYLITGTDGSGGLARQEMMVPTPTDGTFSSLPPGGMDDSTKILAPEIVAVQFQYWDGNTWQDTWDGTVLSADNVTPIGPPLSIAVTVWVARSDNLNVEQSDPTVRQYKHVVQIPTASFFNNQQQPTTSSTGGSTP